MSAEAPRIRALEDVLRGIGAHARSGVGRLEHQGGDAVAQQMFRHIAEQCDEVLTSPRSITREEVQHAHDPVA